MFEIGDILILKEMQRSSDKYTETILSEKLLMVTGIDETPYEHYVVEFPFSKASSEKVVRSKEFLESYYEIYDGKTPINQS
jgi:hypothetical protein